MSTITAVLLAYFVGGLVILFIFDLLTKRVRNNMPMAGTQAQIRMAEANTPITPKVGLILMLVLTWLFWPAVLLGAAASRGETVQETAIRRREPTAAYLLRKIWYGECPNCRVILTPDGWSGSTCPVCKSYFGTLTRARGFNKNGTQKQRANSEDRDGAGGADIHSSEEASRQPDKPHDFEES